jgi:hypothetical protein
MSSLLLPDKVLRVEHTSDATFIETCYHFFKADFVEVSPQFRGARMGLKRLPIRDGKEATFYHMTTTGLDEENRTLEIDRSERIRWARPIIENEGHTELRIWTERKRGENRIHIWHHTEGYVVVISERNGYHVPWTAFYVNYSNYHDKLERRWLRNRT